MKAALPQQVQHLSQAQQQQSEAPSRAAEAAAASETPASASASASAPMVVLLDLDLEAPVVVMPRGTESLDYVELDLGTLKVSNRVGWLETSVPDTLEGQPASVLLRYPECVLVDSMRVQLSEIRGTVAVEGRRSNSLIEEGSIARLEIRRPLRDLKYVSYLQAAAD